MRHSLIIALALCSGAASFAAAADKETARDNTAAHPQSTCCNDVCPVDGKPINKDIRSSPFHQVNGPKSPDLMVGFCSDDCRMAYEKSPALYDADVNKQIQKHREAANPKAN